VTHTLSANRRTLVSDTVRSVRSCARLKVEI
jgi:hypothetical protein